MRPRCETVGCRGNRPCEGCILEIGMAMEDAFAAVFQTKAKNIATDGLPATACRLLAREVLKDVARELRKSVWAKTIGNVGKASEGVGRGTLDVALRDKILARSTDKTVFRVAREVARVESVSREDF